jgi:hypothetical protein
MESLPSGVAEGMSNRQAADNLMGISEIWEGHKMPEILVTRRGILFLFIFLLSIDMLEASRELAKR